MPHTRDLQQYRTPEEAKVSIILAMSLRLRFRETQGKTPDWTSCIANGFLVGERARGPKVGDVGFMAVALIRSRPNWIRRCLAAWESCEDDTYTSMDAIVGSSFSGVRFEVTPEDLDQAYLDLTGLPEDYTTMEARIGGARSILDSICVMTTAQLKRVANAVAAHVTLYYRDDEYRPPLEVLNKEVRRLFEQDRNKQGVAS